MCVRVVCVSVYVSVCVWVLFLFGGCCLVCVCVFLCMCLCVWFWFCLGVVVWCVCARGYVCVSECVCFVVLGADMYVNVYFNCLHPHADINDKHDEENTHTPAMIPYHNVHLI